MAHAIDEGWGGNGGVARHDNFLIEIQAFILTIYKNMHVFLFLDLGLVLGNIEYVYGKLCLGISLSSISFLLMELQKHAVKDNEIWLEFSLDRKVFV